MNTILTILKITIAKTLALLLVALILASGIGYARSAQKHTNPSSQVETLVCFTGSDGDDNQKTF